jgi:DNA repair ATPase RecN
MASKNPKKEPTIRDVMTILRTMKDWMHNIDGRLSGLERRMSTTESRLEDIQETLDAVAEAVSKDSETLIDHERRIKKLERV